MIINDSPPGVDTTDTLGKFTIEVFIERPTSTIFSAMYRFLYIMLVI